MKVKLAAVTALTDPSPRSMSRRGLLGALAASVAAVPVAAVPGCASRGNAAEPGAAGIRFSWWGNEDRARTTQNVIELFERRYPHLTVKGEYRGFDRYFDELNSSVGAGRAPDVITMGGSYPAEYAARGALLDLSTVRDVLRTGRLHRGALADGRVGGRQYGIPSGLNTFSVIADVRVFQRAGVALPDDSMWSWNDFQRIARAVAGKSPPGTYGVADFTRTETLDLFSRQRGESLFTRARGAGISECTMRDLWGMTTALCAAKAAPSAAMTSELAGESLPERTLMGRGLAGMQFDWSNQLSALSKYSGHELQLLRAPGESVEPLRGMWVQASQVYTINAATRSPGEAALFVDFLVNRPEAGRALLTDRGLPANQDVRAEITPDLTPEQREEASFIDRVSLNTDPDRPLIFGPSGAGDIREVLGRLNDDVLSGRKSVGGAAREFVTLVDIALRA